MLEIVFYREGAKEPVREWLRGLSKQDKRVIGEDIKTVQFGWPLGMPVVRKLDQDLWEVRTSLPNGIARTLFTVRAGVIVLLHGFVKKSPRVPRKDLTLAHQRLQLLEEEA